MSLILSGTNGLSDVDGSAATPAIRGTDANTGIFFPAADTIAFSEGGTEAMRIDSSGNVGIGVTSISTQGQLYIGASGTSTDVKIGLSPTNSSGGQNPLAQIGSSADSTFGSTLYFTTRTTAGTVSERMRIDSSGNLLVGGTSTNESFSGIPTIQGSTNCIFTNKRSSTSSASQFRFYNPNGLVGDISTSGSATTYGTSSDYRLKENVAPMTGALATVAQLKPCTYTWKIDGSSGQGFIAHELQAVVPDCVTGEKDAVNEDGSIKPQGIDTSFLIATLTAAIQEQQTLITTLTDRITALEAKP
jgi:hypothetical protein